MKTVLINNHPEEVVKSLDYVAFDEDENMWDVWETKRLFTTSLSTMGRIRFVLDNEDTVLAEALPLFGLNNGFKMENMSQVLKWKQRLKI